jgi:hypothetical protein
VLLTGDSLPTFDPWTLWTIEDKEREEWSTHKLRTTEEQGAKLRVLTPSSMRSMKEPNGCINANAKSTKFGRICFKTINDSNVSERSQGPRWSEDLPVRCVRGSTILDN